MRKFLYFSLRFDILIRLMYYFCHRHLLLYFIYLFVFYYDKGVVILAKERKSNFELLRILAIVFIIFYHFRVHSEFFWRSEVFSVNRLWTLFVSVGGKAGVDIFVLISGYFLCTKENIKIKKVIKLYSQIFFYSYITFFIFKLWGILPISDFQTQAYLMPITNGRWWFASTYFLLFIFSPFINKVISVCDRKQHRNLILLMMLCWCIVPTFLNTSFLGSKLTWFVFLYVFAAYIRKYTNDDTPRFSSGRWFAFSAFLWMLIFGTAFIFSYLAQGNMDYKEYVDYFYDMNKLPLFMLAVSLFMAFKNLNIKHSRFINTVSATTFGIYLIHDNSFMRDFLWLHLFRCKDFKHSDLLIPYSIFCVVVIFIAAALIDYLRIRFIEKPWLKFVDRVLPEKLK